MLLYWICALGIQIMQWIFNKIYWGQTDSIDVINTYIQLAQTIITITTQASNFMYFLFGETYGLILTSTGGLIAYKYVLAPIIRLGVRLLPFIGKPIDN